MSVTRNLTLLTLCLLALAPPVGAASYFYGFESGSLEGWTPDATDQGQCPWHIVPSTKLRYAGQWSLEYYMDNFNDATKIWIERSYDVPAGRRYDVALAWKLATRDSPVSACPVIVYVYGEDPETHDDPIQVIGYSESGGWDYIWLSESYLRTGVLPGTSTIPGQGKIWVAIGMWGTFEVSYTWYVDNVTVEITESAPAVSIGEARQAADNTRVFLRAKAATAGWIDLKSPSNFIGRIYVQEPDRSAGIMVRHYRTFEGDPVRGDVLDVSGVMGTDQGERFIDGATVSWPGSSPSAVSLSPLYVSNCGVGGGPFGSYVPGVVGGTGLNNSGLLISSFGRVVSAGTGYFVIDDGSRRFPCGKSDVNGLAVSTADSLEGVTTPPEGSWVSVSGLVGVFWNGGSHYPIVRVRRQSDIRQLAP